MPPTHHRHLPPLPTTPAAGEPLPQSLSSNSQANLAIQILVIEDHPTTQQLLRDGLEVDGYVVHCASSGAEAVALLQQESITLILLDLMLPDIDGLAVCRAIRATRSTPIIVLSAISQEQWKVELLEAGADDYLTKPAGFAELRARIRAALRRSIEPRAPRAAEQEWYEYGKLRIDVAQRRVTRGDTAIPLTPTEWLLLLILCRNTNRPVATTELIAGVWPDDAQRGQSQLHTYVGHLRKKLGPPDLIETLRGFGYRLRHSEAAHW
jgi:Response regulators consisting of a CheY-like receiver domain and a winged-helix DNA-binding domain